MKKLFTLLLAVSLLFSIAATSAAAEGTGGTMYPNPLQDVRVRQAIDMAVDRQAVLDKAAKRCGMPLTWTPSWTRCGTVP